MNSKSSWLGGSIAILLTVFLSTFSPRSYGAVATDFPFGVYDKAELVPGSAAWRAYYAKLFHLLEENHIDTVLTPPYREVAQTLEILELARQHGIRIILGTGNPQNPAWDFAGPGQPFDQAYRHPSVMAYKYGDEPKEAKDLPNLEDEYSALHKYYRLPIVTAVAGENMDFSQDDFVLSMWDALHSDIRFARHYPIRRTYDLVHWYPQKMKMPFAQWAQKMETSSPKPWWFIAQTFGSGIDKGDAAYWRFPTAAELGAMIHVALANGAHGIVGYALQDHENFQGLVDSDLEPRQARDGSIPLSRYRELATLVHTNAALLLRHKRGDFEIATAAPEIVAVPRYDPLTDLRYAYLVNQDAEQPVIFDLQIPTRLGIETAQNIYTNDPSVRGEIRGAQVVFHLTLAAGAGGFFHLDGKQPKPPVVEKTASRRP